MVGTDRMQAARIATGGKDAHVVPRVYGRAGYDVPVAQSRTFRLKPYDAASDDEMTPLLMRLMLMPRAVCSALKQVPVVPWTICLLYTSPSPRN